jgi:hypothetical protein
MTDARQAYKINKFNGIESFLEEGIIHLKSLKVLEGSFYESFYFIKV